MPTPLQPGFRALVVDDDEICREVTGAVLQQLGAATVAKAPNGAAALAWADAAGSDLELVVCDLKMPQLDGIETLRGLASRARPAMVVIASAADPRLLRAAAQTAARAGIDNVHTLAKPLTLEKMQATLAAAADDQSARWAYWEARTFVPPDCSTKILRGMTTGEFVPFFEPKLAATHDHLVGVHAHLRWLHPSYGVLSPESFTGVAETIGLLGEIVVAVLAEIAVFCAQWQRRQHPLRADVELPPTLLATGDLPRQLEALVADFGLEPDSFAFQVPADLWPSAERETQEILTRLRLRDVGLVADECGPRIATVKQLQDAPFSELKLGDHVIRQAAASPADADTLAALVELAHRQGLRVVAKGVHTAAHRHCAAEIGCDAVQGKLIAPPLPASEFDDWANRSAHANAT